MKCTFDRIVRPYRWMEYLSFGRSLEQCRFRFLPELTGVRHALLLGDGDGRFAARLMSIAPSAHLHAVDSSPGMLNALQRRCSAVGAAERITLQLGKLPGVLVPTSRCWDLVVSHFFLDCLTQQDVERMAVTVADVACPGAKWVISEFAYPSGLLHLPARAIVATLYAAFRILTGLQVRQLPDHATVLRRHGFLQVWNLPSLGGLLVSEL